MKDFKRMFTRGFNIKNVATPLVRPNGGGLCDHSLIVAVTGVGISGSSFTFDSVLALISALLPTPNFLSLFGRSFRSFLAKFWVGWSLPWGGSFLARFWP
ncbi:hypothetical protein DFJ58DRAFT_792871 [Suillus subalutaceus]|uniref:uncharacterized protein n=1 Tax=Suillus subalutaceus TaxID=48586 RepID=UPI001B862F25|nr:uncharacterized protein DFJ58DRAFT_792871 [Suillus subalutaceus]KAG1851340.1 hypothetical protein DFJ58DRAFT_792871 [Suillus subalutaceus]